MRSGKIINFGQFCNKKVFFSFSFQHSCVRKSCLHVSDKFNVNIFSLLLWSDQTRFITFILSRRRFVHFSPEIVTEQIPIFQQLDLLGARFGSVGSPVTQGDHSTMRWWPEFSTLQIQTQIQIQRHAHRYLFGSVSTLSPKEAIQQCCWSDFSTLHRFRKEHSNLGA